MDVVKFFKTDAKKEIDGNWVEIGEGASLLIARAGNPKYSRLLERLQKPHRTAIRRDRLPDDIAEKIVTKVLAETVLIGWKGVFYKDEELEYTPENSLMLLTELKDLKELVAELGRDVSNFKEADEEEDEKN